MTFLGLAPTVDELAGVRYLFTDVDDTLTTDGQLLPQTYQALWDLHDAGIAIIPVTGGSAGWCEHIVRAWPVARVIGESGAFVAEAETGRVKFDFWESQSGQAERQRRLLAAIAPLLGNSFALAHDQQFRLADVAIDIKGQSREEVDELAADIRATGATVAISSIHINTWIGNYNKRAMTERMLQHLCISSSEVAGNTAFVGDSRNDASMFGFIPNSFGVGNIMPVLDQLPFKPRWVVDRHAGLGFVDIARVLLDAR